jgi:hypothetical protein
MCFAADVIGANGVVLVARGQSATRSLVQRIESYWSDFADQLEVHVLCATGPEELCSTGFQRVV